MSTDENQVFLALQEWYQTDTYNLYQSDPQGVYYSIVLENVRSTKQPEESVLIDILEVSHVALLCGSVGKSDCNAKNEQCQGCGFDSRCKVT